MQQSQVQPSVVTYNSAIIACRQDQQWAEAFKTFSQVQQSQVQHYVITYSAAISSRKQSQKWA